MRITETSLEPLNLRFQSLHPEEILKWVHQTFAHRAAILCSMQRAGTALCHMAESAELPFDVLFVDTGLLHAETLATRDRLANTHSHLRIRTLHPFKTFAEQTREHGVLYLTRDGQEQCCELRKTEPLLTVKGQYDILISGLRRSEGGARSRVNIFSLDSRMSALRIHPFAFFTEEALNNYVNTHSVIVNPLHQMGFPTIGCFTCTTPVREDESERAGRWRHLRDVAYCGINPTDRPAAEASIDLDEKYQIPLQAFSK